MTVYAATILLSAFLLFLVQPLIGKVVLPWFGGSAAVWSATLMFFQVALLIGYGYAHVVRRLQPKTQMLVHSGLLAVSLAVLPILPPPSWKPTTAADPTLRILALLTVTIGLPYFLLSSTGPLLQAWYARRNRTGVPYRLFALSNFGSMLGLLSFPFLVEPRLTSRQQAYGWSALYIGFATLCALAAWRSRMDADSSSVPVVTQQSAPETGRPRWTELVLWASLAACASLLLLAVTQHLTQNVAPIPLLWVVPLAVYLLTFILAFESDRVYRRWIFLPMLPPILVLMAHLIYTDIGNAPIKWAIPVFTVGLFVCCMTCHGELARRKPSSDHLTLFYLMVSLGGALGGVFVAIVAPRVFNSYLELPLGLVLCALLGAIVFRSARIPKLDGPEVHVVTFVALIFFAFYAVAPSFDHPGTDRLLTRNFYGALRVVDWGTYRSSVIRRLYHGTILHGEQWLDPQNRDAPTSYYGRQSGVGRAIRALATRRDRLRIGVIGLGAGSIATYGRTGDYYGFYEINPAVVPIAQKQFSFLSDSPADKRILLGDARLTLERQKNQQFDLLAVDAFSGDSVPVHLLTRQAMALYSRHLKPDGILAIHVTNRYLDLIPVCASGVKADQVAWSVYDPGNRPYLEHNTWVLVSAQADWFKTRPFNGASVRRATAPRGFRPWTDNYSNVLKVFRLNPP